MIDKDKIMGFIGLSMKAGKIVFGTEAVIEAINKNKIKLIIVAEDAADRTIKNFKSLAIANNILFVKYGKKIELSKAIGKDNKAVIGIKDKNIAIKLIDKIYGGETIE